MIIHDLYFSFDSPQWKTTATSAVLSWCCSRLCHWRIHSSSKGSWKPCPQFSKVWMLALSTMVNQMIQYIYNVKMLVSTGFPSLTNLLLNRFALCIALQWSLLILPFPRSSCFTAWALAHRTQCCGSKDGSELSDSSKLFEIRMSPWWSQT